MDTVAQYSTNPEPEAVQQQHPSPGETTNQPTQLCVGPAKEHTEHAEPWKIQYYEPAVCDILK